MRVRTIPREQAQQTPMPAAERQRQWRERNPELSYQRSVASKAKKPELYRELNRKKSNAYRARQREHAAICAAAARVTDLWAAYFWHAEIDAGTFEDAIAQLAALLPEQTP